MQQKTISRVDINKYWKRGIEIYNSNKNVRPITLQDLQKMRVRGYNFIRNSLDTDVYLKPYKFERQW